MRRERAERGGAARREDEVHPRGQTPLAPDALRGARRLGTRICSLPAALRPRARRRLLRGDLRLVRLLRAPREVCARLEGGAPPRRLHRSPGSLREDGGDGVDVFERGARELTAPAVPLPCRATGTQHSGEGKKGPEYTLANTRARARILYLCEFPLFPPSTDDRAGPHGVDAQQCTLLTGRRASSWQLHERHARSRLFRVCACGCAASRSPHSGIISFFTHSLFSIKR